MRRVENYAGRWVLDFDRFIVEDSPGLMHHEAHSPTRRRIAACGEPLTGGVWAGAEGMFTHIRNHSRRYGGPSDVAYGCGCYSVCGPCLYWAGWVA